MSVPYELDEAARIDGANHLQILWRVLLPLSAPAVATIVMFSFVTHWNDFLTPLIYLTDAKKYTLALGLYNFVGQYATRWNLLLAASFLMLVPVLVVFFAAQRYFIEGLQFSGLGGK
jgi:multiple sugar transport system permease protein